MAKLGFAAGIEVEVLEAMQGQEAARVLNKRQPRAKTVTSENRNRMTGKDRRL
ncbi:MAG: hypothetical protein ACRD2D_12490 [Terriglobales bacterium]